MTDCSGHSSFTVRGTDTVVSLHGEFDLANVGEVDQRVFDALAQAGDALVIDLAECSYLDSTGIGALVRAHRAAQRANRPMRITGAHDIVLRVLQLSHVEDNLSRG